MVLGNEAVNKIHIDYSFPDVKDSIYSGKRNKDGKENKRHTE